MHMLWYVTGSKQDIEKICNENKEEMEEEIDEKSKGKSGKSSNKRKVSKCILYNTMHINTGSEKG